MPGGNGTGPMGTGPRTGRGAGFCSGYGMAGYANVAVRGGFNRCFGGGGRGRRNRFFATGVPGWAALGIAGISQMSGSTDETIVLKNQAKYLQQSLDDINKKIEHLQSAKQK
jgi:hypothetical protein